MRLISTSLTVVVEGVFLFDKSLYKTITKRIILTTVIRCQNYYSVLY